MHKETTSFFSRELNREMPLSIYGHGGKSCVVFPCQDGRHMDFEGFGMVDTLSPWINAGRLRLFCVDSIDRESWSAAHQHPRYSIEMQEKYFHYLTDELVPFIYDRAWSDDPIMTFGTSMGACHAAIAQLRRPDLFDAAIALSGFYKADVFFGDYMDDLVYDNSPCDFLRGMPRSHHYMPLYHKSRLYLCIGQGRWEETLLPSNHEINQLLIDKGLPHRVDFWGYDVDHDWPWWHRMASYFMNKELPL
jgi:esterase/lipase superfamily enzyme